MDFPCCPICNFPVPAPELERHANGHVEEDQLSRDLELAKQLALADSPTPIKSRGENQANAQFDYDPALYDYEYDDPRPADIPSSSTSRFRGKSGPSEALGIDEQVCRAVMLQCRAAFHKIEGGLTALLKKCLESESEYSKCMLSGYIDHFQSTKSEDQGWGCGWRNIQMASSYLLLHRPEAKEALFSGCGFVPDIASLQRWLEIAWGKGFDAVGSSHFDGNVYGTKKWIGTTECATLFRSFGLRARVADFDGEGDGNNAEHMNGPMDKFVSRSGNNSQHKNGPMDKFISRRKSYNAHNCHKKDISFAKKSKGYQVLVDWVWNYFSDNCPTHRVKERVCVTNKMPLYFQHDGHSRTIVGIQVKHQKNGVKQYNLLILDPGHSTIELEKSLKANAGWQGLIKRGIHTLKMPQYQLCYVDSGIACGEELEQLKNIHSEYLQF